MLARKLKEDQGNFSSPGPAVTAHALRRDRVGNSFQLSQISVTIIRSVISHEEAVSRAIRHGVGFVFTDGAPFVHGTQLEFRFLIRNLLINIGG